MSFEKAARATKVACPECDELIEVRSNIKWGERVTCRHCDTELEVISTNPVELDWVFEDADYEYEDEGEIQEIMIWFFVLEFAESSSLAHVRFGAHLALTTSERLGASHYPGSALHVRMYDL